ncbi:MAG: Translation initiation factor IF-2 [Alphaproteobacteria bacterium MarineAlpha3_Bin2]|nr:MAG: Translation initiation factor IF-2 [Alphaproteobacteria bacterium MarineAlpha3_Bin1]PPR74458.1 MAG: Translation initiation factor IF-2 [Alphaproteobacteria bacterium MarineAlpha3_Bin2]
MAETEKQKEGKKLGLSRPGKLELKKTVETGQVRQNFSHGRSRMVTVEVRKKRTFAPDAGGHMAEIPAEKDPVAEEQVPEEDERAPDVEVETAAPASGAPTLTEEEKASRARALEGAKLTEKEKAAPPTAKPDQAVPSELGSDKKSEAEEAKREEQAKAAASAAAAKLEAIDGGEAEAEKKGRVKRGSNRDGQRPPPVRRTEPRRRSGKLTIAEALGDSEERTRSLASIKRAREKEKQQQQEHLSEGKKIIRDVIIPETITVQELANRMAERSVDVIKTLMNMGVMATITQIVDADTAELVVAEFGHNLKRVSESDVELGLKGEEDDTASLVSRPPVVTVMGHVDHGKTSLLDAIRETDVAAHEKGGITQHIGAYQVTLSSGAKISFIDTPGHAAFTEMRARGANVTDLVVLCVAADDGVMPQTIEAIDHAKAAKVPIIVAINKIDKEGANPARIRTDLLQHDLVLEEMGGDVLAVEVSATEKTNLDKLEETILLQAELMDLKANPDRSAEGVVVEAKMEQGRGSVATVLVQRGTLKVGDIFVAGDEWGRVRALIDVHGENLDEAGPSMPVEVLGLNGTPNAGEEVAVVESEGRAREVVDFRQRRIRDEKAVAGARGTLEQMFEKIKEGSDLQMLPVVIKADVKGSVEAIIGALNNMATDEVKAHVLHSGVGGINESDITLANASGGVVIGFNVRANFQARELARQDNVEIRYYSIIYDLLDDLKKTLSGMLAPTIKENLLGYAEIREVFNISKVGKIAGCMVTEGVVRRGAKVRVVRDEIVIHEGELSQLKRFKDDAKEVKDSTECGMGFANFHDLEVGDMVECFETEEISREL